MKTHARQRRCSGGWMLVAFICVVCFAASCSEPPVDQPFEVSFTLLMPPATLPEDVQVTIDDVPAEWQVGGGFLGWASIRYSRSWPSLLAARDDGLRLSVSLVGDERVDTVDVVDDAVRATCEWGSLISSRLRYVAVKETDPVSGADTMTICSEGFSSTTDRETCEALTPPCVPEQPPW